LLYHNTYILPCLIDIVENCCNSTSLKKEAIKRAMYVWVELEGKEAEKFVEIKKALGLKASAEVLRFLVKKFRIPKVIENGG